MDSSSYQKVILWHFCWQGLQVVQNWCFHLLEGYWGIDFSDKSLANLKQHIRKEDWREWEKKIQNESVLKDKQIAFGILI